MLDIIFIIKFTENLTESKKLCKAIGHPKKYYEASLSHIVFELCTMGHAENFKNTYNTH